MNDIKSIQIIEELILKIMGLLRFVDSLDSHVTFVYFCGIPNVSGFCYSALGREVESSERFDTF